MTRNQALPAVLARMKMTPRLALTAALALLVACGDDGNTSSTNPAAIDTSDSSSATASGSSGNVPSEECLVTLDEVTAALPDDINPGFVDHIDLTDASICGFSWTKFKQGTLQVTSYPGTAATLEEINPKRGDAVDVSGLGDRAYATGGERSVSLAVFKADNAVVVSITQFPPDQNIAPRLDEWQSEALSAAKELAAVALNRL